MQPRTFSRPGAAHALTVAGRARSTRRLLAAVPLVGLVVALAACSASTGPVTAPDSPSATGAASAVVPSAASLSAEEKFRQAIQTAVQKGTAGEGHPSAEVVRAAIASALPAGAAVEVGQSVTPTGQASDSLVGAAVVAPGRCAFVYLRDGVVSSALLPALADGKCFVGDQS
ncbi:MULTISPECIES: hypothetical protein [Arthrobacter]|uniref:DUF6993 domain-containing protein n=2 Tax=Arthrobacter TaxID=1663 RepID=A0ABU9KFI7_9MICC|nr:hypothetical protein [Arthrobacter sp. YJM1]MDP5225637.1 hypothetical protein [Arthrobacter sp. YJM1]